MDIMDPLGWFANHNGYNNGSIYIEMPLAVQIHSYKISAVIGHDPAIPNEWTLYGSSDGGTTWSVISNVTNVTLQVDVLTNITLDTPSAAYNMFKLELRKTTNTSDKWIGLGKFIPLAFVP